MTNYDHCYAKKKISSYWEEGESLAPTPVTSKLPRLVEEDTDTASGQTDSFFVGRCGFKKCKFETTSYESFSKVSGVGFVTANGSQQHFVYFRLWTQL